MPQDFEREDVLVLVGGMGMKVTRINTLTIFEFFE